MFKPDDKVSGHALPAYSGLARRVRHRPARAFARKSAVIDHVQAGALPLAALTAWQALADTAQPAAGQRVLIHAAARDVDVVLDCWLRPTTPI